MLWDKYPESLDGQTLQAAYQTLQGDSPSKIPFVVWLFENPSSPIALPGSIDLYGHDCIHLILRQGFKSDNEAYVVGFTMGNDVRTNELNLLIFKFAARFLYPQKYRFSQSDLDIFERGFELGRKVKVKNLNQGAFLKWQSKTLEDIRVEVGLAT